MKRPRRTGGGVVGERDAQPHLVVGVLQHQQPQRLQTVVDALPPALLHDRFGNLGV